MIAATVSCKRRKKYFTHLPVKSVKYWRLLILNLSKWKLWFYLKERQILVNARKKYTRKKWSGKKEKGPVDQLEKLILNRYILVNMVFLKKSSCFCIFDI